MSDVRWSRLGCHSVHSPWSRAVTKRTMRMAITRSDEQKDGVPEQATFPMDRKGYNEGPPRPKGFELKRAPVTEQRREEKWMSRTRRRRATEMGDYRDPERLISQPQYEGSGHTGKVQCVWSNFRENGTEMALFSLLLTRDVTSLNRNLIDRS